MFVLSTGRSWLELVSTKKRQLRDYFSIVGSPVLTSSCREHYISLFVSLFLSHEVSSYLHYKVLYSYPFLGIISKVQCYKIDIKELSSREKVYNVSKQ